MADIRLPELKPAHVDYVNAFARGYAAPDVMQAPGLANELQQQKIDEQNREIAAGNVYAKTKNLSSLIPGDPFKAAALIETDKKRATDAMIPGLKMAYAYADNLKNPATYKPARDMLVSANPWMAQHLPEEWHPEIPAFVDQQKASVERLLKLEGKPTNYLLKNNELIPVGQGRVFNADPRGLSYDERVGLIKERAAISPGGKAGGGRGLTGPQMRNNLYQEFLKNPDTPENERNWGGFLQYEARNKRPDSTSTTTQPSRNEKTTKKTYGFPPKPGKPGTRDAVLDAIGSYRGEMPSPAGQENLTPIGKTTDGRIIYKDASGKTGTKD